MIVGRIRDGKYYRPGDPGFDDDFRDDRPVKTISAIRPDKPLVSTSAAVPSYQVDSFNKKIKDAGISGAYHRKDGNVVFESRNARNQYLKLRGLKDGDGSYGDYCGENN